jgi:dCMP deaminase
VCHAAIHAILNKNAENLRGCTLFTTLFPSHEDAKMIIQAGIYINKVVYLNDDDRTLRKLPENYLKLLILVLNVLGM